MRVGSSLRIIVVAVLAVASLIPGDVATAQAVTVQRDIQYAQPDGVPLLMDAYVPTTPGPHAGVVVVHGGRFRTGDRSLTPAEELAEAGYAAFSVDYRLAPEHPFPAALEDVRSAVRWVRDHADEYDVDPALIWTMGGSAGGHLAALLATVGEGPIDRGSRVAAAVSLSGPTDMARWLQIGGPVITDFLGCSDPTDPACAATARQASPTTHVDPTDPPIFLANGTEEIIPLWHATTMADTLEREDVPHELWTPQTDRHAWSLGREAMSRALTFVGAALAGQGGVGSTPPKAPPSERETVGDAGRNRSPEPSAPGVLFPVGIAMIVLAIAMAVYLWLRRPARRPYG
jgi:acetyl esterase